LCPWAAEASEVSIDPQMISPVWQLQGHNARLHIAPLTAAIDLLRPALGLAELACEAHFLGNARVLGVELPSSAAVRTDSLLECYVRGSDLVAAYKESDNWPVRVDATWRAGSSLVSNGPLARVELVVSVRTERLDSRPELSVQTAVPTGDVLRLVDAGNARFESLGRKGPCVIDPEGGPGCLVFRLAGSDLSYAEMVHPTDFVEDRLSGMGESQPIFELRHRLFQDPLEKGVILRARVCGMLLRRDDDTRTAAQCYAAFSAAEPPLGA